MGWKESLQPAKFRDILFFVDASDTSAGRKVAIHEFPGKNINYVEDLGRSTKTFSFDAFILGENYNIQRDALILAFEQKGIGDLNHPYLGDLKVQLIRIARIRESIRDGGMAVLSLVFSESEEPTIPIPTVNTKTNLLNEINETIDGVVETFEDIFDVFQAGQAIVDGVSATINNATVALETIKSHGKKALDFQTNFDNLKTNATALALSVTGIANTFIFLFTGDDTIEGLLENLDLKDFGKDELINEPNNKALNLLIRQSAVIGSAKASTGIDFENTSQAEEIRNLLSKAIDDLMAESDDKTYELLHSMRGALLLDIETRSLDIPIILEIELPDSMPSLFLAYNLYEDIGRAQEIVDRNNVIHPGFIPGGETLEVLSRE